MVRIPIPRWIDRWDDPVDRAFGRLRGHRSVDRLFYGASFVGDHGIVWVVAGGALALRGRDEQTRARNRRAAARVGIGVAVESIIVNLGIKSLFRRTRPVVQYERPFHLRIPLTSSFPSGHATSAFCAAVLLADADPALAPVYYGAATVVAASRIHVQIHHASDVAGGVVLGLLLGHIGIRVSPLDRNTTPTTEG
jgi:undecaprenyl-diphosphatase